MKTIITCMLLSASTAAAQDSAPAEGTTETAVPAEDITPLDGGEAIDADAQASEDERVSDSEETEAGPTLEAIVNKAAWESLPEDLQRMVEVAAAAANDDLLSEFTARNASSLKTLLSKHNVELRRLPDDVLAKLKAESEVVVAEATGDSDLARRIRESYGRFLSDVREYHAISEQAYINAR